ncbi:MAG: hypothetical protein ACYC2H_05810 [Thermoplasmatota archaeon]
MRRTTLGLLALLGLLAGCADPGLGNDEGAASSATEPDSGIVADDLSVGADRAVITLPDVAGHSRLAFVLVLTNNLPQTTVALNVTGPDGRSNEVRTGPTLYALPGMRPSFSFADPGAGEWMATVELRSGATAGYEVHWCADDEAMPGPQDNLACQRDYA